jgi:hypothetical protein
MKWARCPLSPRGKLILWKRQFERVTGELMLWERLNNVGVEGSELEVGDFAFA